MSNMKLLSMSLTLIVATLIIPSSAEMEQPMQRVQPLFRTSASTSEVAAAAAAVFGRGKSFAVKAEDLQSNNNNWIDKENKTLAIAEVEIRDGRARATSNYGSNNSADKAFILGHAHPWINAENTIFPAMVWYEFHVGTTFAPGRISFRPPKDPRSMVHDQVPTVWQFIGSNDENCGRYGNWTVLCEDQSNTGYISSYWTKYCDVDVKIFKKFRCLGISVLNTKSTKGYASLKDVRMWKKKYE